MECIQTLEQAEQVLQAHRGVLFYFSSEDCGVCKALKPKVIHAAEVDYPELKLSFIDIKATPNISAHYGIYTIPAIIVFWKEKSFSEKLAPLAPAN